MLVTHLYSLLVFFSLHNSLDVDAGQVDVLRSKCTHFHYLLHLGREGIRDGIRDGIREGGGKKVEREGGREEGNQLRGSGQ